MRKLEARLEDKYQKILAGQDKIMKMIAGEDQEKNALKFNVHIYMKKK